MALLPSGYTKLEYIESSGTQYIDTGFIPNQDSAVHIVCQPTVASGWQGIFGARSATNVGEFGVDIPAGTTLRSVYGTGNVTTTVSTVATKLDIYKNKNVCTINGAVLTNSTETFSSGYPIWIFDKNTAGAKWNPCSMKLYSCKVYDNGTLVRDFIPCKNANGTLGLWDNVNSVFYANAGTGTFSTGTKHKTLINGTGYEIKSGRVLIAGTGYDIKKGRTLIGGTGYDIKFGVPVGELAEGTIIKINENGSPVEFYIAKHDYESDLNGTGRTLVVRKSSYRIVYDECGKSFFTSTVYTLLNNTYFKLLDTNIQSAIGKTKFKYTGKMNDYSNESQYVATGESSVFLLSATELGTTSTEGKADGSVLPAANILKIAYYNGSAAKQLTRTRGNASPGHLLHFEANGTLGNTIYEDVPYRPVFTLSAGTLIDSDFNIIPA